MCQPERATPAGAKRSSADEELINSGACQPHRMTKRCIVWSSGTQQPGQEGAIVRPAALPCCPSILAHLWRPATPAPADQGRLGGCGVHGAPTRRVHRGTGAAAGWWDAQDACDPGPLGPCVPVCGHHAWGGTATGHWHVLLRQCGQRLRLPWRLARLLMNSAPSFASNRHMRRCFSAPSLFNVPNAPLLRLTLANILFTAAASKGPREEEGEAARRNTKPGALGLPSPSPSGGLRPLDTTWVPTAAVLQGPTCPQCHVGDARASARAWGRSGAGASHGRAVGRGWMELQGLCALLFLPALLSAQLHPSCRPETQLPAHGQRREGDGAAVEMPISSGGWRWSDRISNGLFPALPSGPLSRLRGAAASMGGTTSSPRIPGCPSSLPYRVAPLHPNAICLSVCLWVLDRQHGVAESLAISWRRVPWGWDGDGTPLC